MKDFWKPKKINFKPMNFNMKPIKVKPMFGISKPANFSNFGITKNPVPRKPNKNLSYPQAKRRYSGLSPFGDWDRDGRVNMFDCRPFDFWRHRVPPEYSEREVKTYSVPGSTFSSVFSDAENQMPDVFKGPWEDEYSEYLTESLLGRSETPSSPFKDVVGVYSISIPMNQAQTQLVHEYIDKALSSIYPNMEFVFDVDEPKYVTIIDYDKQPGEKGYEYKSKISNVISKLEKEISQMKKLAQGKVDVNDLRTISYLERTARELQNLMTQLVPHTPVKVWISDYPVDILRKSTNQGWTSCERQDPEDRGEFEMGPYSDIENWNGIAYFYMGGREPKKDGASARVMLRWGYDESGKPEIGIERDVYPFSKTGANEDTSMGLSLIQGVQEILQKKGYGTRVFRTGVGRAYSDTGRGSEGKVTYKPYPKPKGQEIADIHAFKFGFAEKRKVPKPFIPFMMREADVGIVRHIAKQEKLPEPYVSKLSRHPVWTIRKEVAKRKELSEPIISRLAKDTSEQVRTGLLTYREFEEGHEREKFRELPKETVKEILSNVDTAYEISSRRNLPNNLMKLLAGHKAAQVRRNMARRDDLPDSIIKKLSKDKVSEVQISLIESNYRKIWQMRDVIENLLKGTFPVIGALLDRVSLPDDLYVEVVRKADSITRKQIASVSCLPTEVALMLSKDVDEGVLYNLITNNNLLSSIEIPIKKKMLSNILKTAIKNKNSDILGKVARKHYLTSTHIKKLLDYLESTKDNWVLRYLASNSQIPQSIRPTVFSFIIDSGNEDAIYSLLDNSSVPHEIREIAKEMI